MPPRKKRKKPPLRRRALWALLGLAGGVALVVWWRAAFGQPP